jgi:hypothetical protein
LFYNDFYLLLFVDYKMTYQSINHLSSSSSRSLLISAIAHPIKTKNVEQFHFLIWLHNLYYTCITGKIKMAPKISNKLAKHINDLCLNEENSDVHFELPISMKTPKLTKVYILYLFIIIVIELEESTNIHLWQTIFNKTNIISKTY